MKFLILILLINPIYSLSNIFASKIKCDNCKHFIKPEASMPGKCSLFPVLNNIEYGNQHLDVIRARSNHYMCGEKGRYYEEATPVEVIPFLTSVDPSFFDNFSEFDFDFEQYIQFL
jgi:hypothetical protein